MFMAAVRTAKRLPLGVRGPLAKWKLDTALIADDDIHRAPSSSKPYYTSRLRSCGVTETTDGGESFRNDRYDPNVVELCYGELRPLRQQRIRWVAIFKNLIGD